MPWGRLSLGCGEAPTDTAVNGVLLLLALGAKAGGREARGPLGPTPNCGRFLCGTSWPRPAVALYGWLQDRLAKVPTLWLGTAVETGSTRVLWAGVSRPGLGVVRACVETGWLKLKLVVGVAPGERRKLVSP